MRIKICCIASHQEASLAITAGASALGFVSAMPSGPGVIDDQEIADIVVATPVTTETFLLTSRQDADSIIKQHATCRTSTLQLVDRVAYRELKKLRQQLPAVTLVQVIHVTGTASIEEAHSVAGLVDVLLLDSGNQALDIKELGGTGRTHDWQISRRICAEISLPVFLAGGLDPFNVKEAIDTVNPFGVDLCSGVRTGGKLDIDKLTAFVDAVSQSQRSKSDEA